MTVWLAAVALVGQEAVVAQTTQRQQALAAVMVRFTQPNAPGCAAGVARNGRTVHESAFGLAHLEHPAPNTPATVFEAGSASKHFTAAAILLLAQEGRVDLNADVRTYLPELPDVGEPITVDQLLRHTSGLRDWRYLLGLAGAPLGFRVHSNADVMELARRTRGLNHAPGAEYSYTNTGYTLATTIVERVTGKSLAAFTQERFFTPLGMTNTRWRDDFRQVLPGRATAYSQAGQRWIQDMPFENAHGAGGLLTTVGDMLKWNAALEQNRLGPRITEQLQEETRLDDGTRVAYGRGLFVERHRGAMEFGHGGVTSGYRAWSGRYPEHRLSVVVLCNSGAVNPVEIARALADAHLPAAALSLPAHSGGATADRARPGGPPATPAGERWAPSPEELQAFAGRYVSDEIGAAYVLTVESGRLTVRIDFRPTPMWTLAPTFQDRFVFPLGRLRFVRNAAGQPAELLISVDRVRDFPLRRGGSSPSL